MNYLSCIAEIRGNFTYLSEGVSKNKRCRIFRRNTVYLAEAETLQVRVKLITK